MSFDDSQKHENPRILLKLKSDAHNRNTIHVVYAFDGWLISFLRSDKRLSKFVYTIIDGIQNCIYSLQKRHL